MTDADVSISLAQPEDAHDQQEWEAAAAAVLRKAGRLTDEDPDALVWDKLTRTTLDGIGISPLGTPALLDGLRTAGRPTRSPATTSSCSTSTLSSTSTAASPRSG
jgi:methylmalonyl-CoA mutase